MHPELFEIPFTHLTVKSYGLMMVIGFICAVSLIRRLSKNITPDPQYITNAALYSLIAGVVGARIFYVVHHFDQFYGRLPAVFAIWQGGLELLGGVILAITVIFLFLRYHKLPIRRYLDILAVGLVLALAFGRLGCFMNGCCYGKPTDLPWAVRFPYASPPYQSQVQPDYQRSRSVARMELPEEFFGFYFNGDSSSRVLKQYSELTEDQKQYLKDNDKLRSLPIHPTQLYSTANAPVLCLILFLFRRRSQKEPKDRLLPNLFAKPGCSFGLMFILYGITRFVIEYIRDDNPFEDMWWILYKGGTISQNLGIYLILLGAGLMILFQKMKPDTFKLIVQSNQKNSR
jgi:phosphatidylglycerol:prolipoprotein diacylglycerol transferase